jgi:predicted metalloprotease with PDZ domain
MQHLSDLEATVDGVPIKTKRFGVDGVRLIGISDFSKLVVTYRVLAVEMTCRANHLSDTHVHIMPPYTWMLPSKGIDLTRLDKTHNVNVITPKNWKTVTQLPSSGKSWKAYGRDELLDGIFESNENDLISWEVAGKLQHLKVWDSGNVEIPKHSIDRFIKSATLVIEEHYALFGLPDWDEYLTVLHFTERGRGGLEHLRSQTSMMPRKCLQEGNEEEWRDLISLFSHEFLHQWNVKQLRPRNFINYDLQTEVHTDLLWWFEGGTSWLGDILCLRSGAWSEEDWRKDWMRKMKRHTSRNGMLHESLSESSHDAWIHLYRPNSYSREVQISYYLEGEMAIFCLDVELRKRSKGESGMDDVMKELYHNHRIGSGSEGITYLDIRKALTNTKGGGRLGKTLDELVNTRNTPDVETAMANLGLKLEREKEQKGAWVGLNTTDSTGRVIVRTHLAGSPCRESIQTGDEIVAINGLRITKSKELSAAIYGYIDAPMKFVISRDGGMKTISVTPISNPEHQIKVVGKGNKIWNSIKNSKR